MKKKAIIILSVALIIAVAGILTVRSAAPEWEAYLWVYQTDGETLADMEDLQDNLRAGLQDIGKSSAENGLSAEVIQSFGSARSISILFKVTFPESIIDLKTIDLANEEAVYPIIKNARLYKGEIAQADIS